uniref:NADH dehydrogenase subunit 6 n=1 Tax=Macrocheles muscaedomesticae TaxID=406086 RepID=A0A6B9WGZ4_9ACAR|nr:NADH dehydrogenase subunit 6 [Macrocheles muscaedomesticae]QHQ98534.1 NADH dehydrogenase subunit 6 [Macrocheles muscaedomesticae]
MMTIFLNIFIIFFMIFSNPMFQLINMIFIILILSFMMYFYMTWPILMFLFAMISGLLVLFTYIISLIDNKNLNKNINNKLIILFIILIFIFNSFLMKMSNSQQLLPSYFNNWLMEIFKPMNLFAPLFYICYILICLLIVMEIISNSKSTLRSS